MLCMIKEIYRVSTNSIWNAVQFEQFQTISRLCTMWVSKDYLQGTQNDGHFFYMLHLFETIRACTISSGASFVDQSFLWGNCSYTQFGLAYKSKGLGDTYFYKCIERFDSFLPYLLWWRFYCLSKPFLCVVSMDNFFSCIFFFLSSLPIALVGFSLLDVGSIIKMNSMYEFACYLVHLMKWGHHETALVITMFLLQWFGFRNSGDCWIILS